MAAGRPQVELKEDTYCPTLCGAFDALSPVFLALNTTIALALAFASEGGMTAEIAGISMTALEWERLGISGLQGGILLKLSPGEDNRSFSDGLASHT